MATVIWQGRQAWWDAIAGDESSPAKRKKGSQDLGSPRDLQGRIEERMEISPRVFVEVLRKQGCPGT